MSSTDKQVDWPLRAWEHMDWDKWYTANDAVSVILGGSYSTRFIPRTKTIAIQMARSGYFDTKIGQATVPDNCSTRGSKRRNDVIHYRRRVIQ